MTQFNVIRAHIGDREYAVGDTREANEVEVKHLIGTCLAPVEPDAAGEPIDPDAGSEAEKDAGGSPENKALKGAPKNKAVADGAGE